MKNKILNASMLLGTTLFASSVFAMPSLNGFRCFEKYPNLKNPANGSGIQFDETCKVAYVLPPKVGKVSLSSISRSSNIQYCPDVMKAGERTASLNEIIDMLTNRVRITTESMAESRSEILAADQEKIQINAQVRKLGDRVKNLEATKEQLDAEVAELVQTVIDCRGDAPSLSPEQCVDAKDQLAEMRNEVKLVGREITAAKREKAEAEEQLELITAKVKSLKEEAADFEMQIDSIRSRIDSMKNSINAEYVTLAAREGATAQLVYTLEMNKLVNDYIAENPELEDQNVRFQAVPLHDVQMFANMRLSLNSNELLTLPALLSSAMPGVNPSGPNHVGEFISAISAGGNSIDEINRLVKIVNDGFLNGSLNSASGSVILSLAGICPYFPEGERSVEKTKISSEDLAAHLVVNAELKYHIKSNRKYKATYNMQKIVSKMERKAQSRNYILGHKELYELATSDSFDDAFEIVFEEDHSDNSFSAEEKSALIASAKLDLMTRALNQLGIPSAATAGPVLPASDTSNQDFFDNIGMIKAIFSPFSHVVYTFGGVQHREAIAKFNAANSISVSDSSAQSKALVAKSIVTFTHNQQ